MRYQENSKIQKQYRKKRYQEKTKGCDKIEKFLQQVIQLPYYICICTICHRNLHQRSVRSFKHKKYRILTAELYTPVKSFDEKLYI